MSISIDDFLSRLRGVRSRGNGNFMACCPAHEDKSPSLSVTQSDGRILMTCFAGCPAESVLSSIGLKFDDLFPDAQKRQSESTRTVKRRIQPADALRVLSYEMTLAMMCMFEMRKGNRLSANHEQLLEAACERLNICLEAANVDF